MPAEFRTPFGVPEASEDAYFRSLGAMPTSAPALAQAPRITQNNDPYHHGNLIVCDGQMAPIAAYPPFESQESPAIAVPASAVAQQHAQTTIFSGHGVYIPPGHPLTAGIPTESSILSKLGCSHPGNNNAQRQQ
jgi:hypothetical protein